MVYLIAHTGKNGGNVAQAKIEADGEGKAKQEFRKLFPEREITAIGIEGVDES